MIGRAARFIFGDIPGRIPPPRSGMRSVLHRDPWARFEASQNGPMTLGILDRVPTGRPVLPEAAALLTALLGTSAGGILAAQGTSERPHVFSATAGQRRQLQAERRLVRQLQRLLRDKEIEIESAPVGYAQAHDDLRREFERLRDPGAWSNEYSHWPREEPQE
jgi:hypothetical protein